jgi:hypothetical protein
VSGTVVETNAALNDTPALVRRARIRIRAPSLISPHFGLILRVLLSWISCFNSQVNQSPFGDAWIMKVKLSNPAGAQKHPKKTWICAHFADVATRAALRCAAAWQTSSRWWMPRRMRRTARRAGTRAALQRRGSAAAQRTRARRMH